jgi:hypothetical protein
MTSRVLSRTTVVIATTGLVSAGLLGAAGAKPAQTQLAKTHLTIKSASIRVNKVDKYKATINGKLRSHKAGVADEVVGLNERKAGKTKWTATGLTATTDANGAVSFTLTQTNEREQYQLSFAGDSTYKKSHSGSVTVNKATAPHTNA